MWENWANRDAARLFSFPFFSRALFSNICLVKKRTRRALFPLNCSLGVVWVNSESWIYSLQKFLGEKIWLLSRINSFYQSVIWIHSFKMNHDSWLAILGSRPSTTALTVRFGLWTATFLLLCRKWHCRKKSPHIFGASSVPATRDEQICVGRRRRYEIIYGKFVKSYVSCHMECLRQS